MAKLCFNPERSRPSTKAHFAAKPASSFLPTWLHRPFTGRWTSGRSFQSRTGSTGHLAYSMVNLRKGNEFLQFQSRTGSTGHLAFKLLTFAKAKNSQFQSRTGSTGHLAAENRVIRWRFIFQSFNPERAPQAI